MRPGIKTTEFWMALAVVVFSSLAAMYAEKEWAQVAGVVGAALASAGYGFARSQAKQGESLERVQESLDTIIAVDTTIGDGK